MSQRGDTAAIDRTATDPSVAVRLRTLRTEHPAATISTELTRLDEQQAVVRAEIVLPTGGSASAYGAAASSRQDAVEDAEDRALGRALAALGYVGQTRIAPAEEAAPTAPPVTRIEPIKSEPQTPTPEPQVVAAEKPVDDGADPPLEDYSWTAFWQWARKHGYQNKVEIESLIGQSITSLSPAQVRSALRAKTGID
jgi:hypothetical protein